MHRQRQGAKYCTDACRQRGQRRRESQLGARTRVLSVTSASRPIQVQVAQSVTVKPADCAVQKQPRLDPRIVPDAKWSGMCRIRLRDGSLSDMVNLTRAKDALTQGAA
jgi:hypothetical protein